MANQDEPITNNPLLPFLRIPSFKSTSALPPSLTPIQTLAVGQQARAAKLGDIRMEEGEGEGTKGEGAVKPLWRHCCPNYRVLYMKEGEIRLLGFHVSTKKKLNRIQTQTSPNITKHHQTSPNITESTKLHHCCSGLQFCSCNALGPWASSHHSRWNFKSFHQFWGKHPNRYKTWFQQFMEFRCQGTQVFYLIYIEQPI